MVTYAATLDVPRHIVVHLSRLLAAHRRGLGTPRGSRELGTFRQAVVVLRWFRERGCVHCLARDAGISQATSYRYLHEGIDILAAQAPDLHEALDRCREEEMSHVILGMLIESDRLAGTRDNGTEDDLADFLTPATEQVAQLGYAQLDHWTVIVLGVDSESDGGCEARRHR
ncbi:hypothetical protein ACFW2D_14380 [Streptomyces sp. NPDC058914]|uniref:hypothetical protein n=1 Tax=Streptomyces TaxID=1883 RepID=UPI00369E00B6